MTMLIILGCILALILLITWGKMNAFIAFLIISLVTGLALGIPLNQVSASVQKGLGDTLGSLVIIICLGAMLGKLVADSGAAEKITSVLVGVFGKKYIQWALMITGFIVGIPLFYNVGFVLLVPLIFSVVYQYKLPAVYIGLPMLASMSVTHGFLPPHPSPAALVAQFHANMGLTLLYGLTIAVPAILIAGPLYATTLKKIHSVPLKTFQPKQLDPSQLPGAVNSFLTSLFPVLLLIATTVLSFTVDHNSPAYKYITFFGDPVIVMLLSLLTATYTLGTLQGKRVKDIMKVYADSVADIAVILLIIGGAGALKQVFSDSGVSAQIGATLMGLNVHPLLLGWIIASVIRISLGSATIAGLTTAGIIAPLMVQSHVDPNLMVLSIGAGSLMFSHVNDSGFWLFKEYFNLSVKDTIRSWSLMETIVGIVGLIGVMILNWIIN
jgi:Gnt-I system high-affinity gluconate transporter